MIAYFPNMRNDVQSAHASQERRGQIQEDPFESPFPFEVVSERFRVAFQAAIYFFNDCAIGLQY